MGGAIRSFFCCSNGCHLTPNWHQKFMPWIHFETTLASLHQEGKEGGGHFLTIILKPVWFQNESDESTFLCIPGHPFFSRSPPVPPPPLPRCPKLIFATQIWPDGATCVFLYTWGCKYLTTTPRKNRAGATSRLEKYN